MTNDTDVKIPAGHEFYISTNPADAESGSAEQIYMDYVRLPHSRWPILKGRR